MSLDKSDLGSVSASVWVIKDHICHPACRKVLDEPKEGRILRSGFRAYRYHFGSLSGSMQEYYLEDTRSGLE